MNACLQTIFTGLAFLVAVTALCTARKIMVNQLFANLVADYRSPEMGAAVLAVFHFFVNECSGDVSAIDKKYHDKYEEQIGKHLNSNPEEQKGKQLNSNPEEQKGKHLDSNPAVNFSQTLHFQRRLVAQFYYNLAILRFKHCIFGLKNEDLKVMFTQEENKLLSIILHMAEPASNVLIRAGNIPEPPQTKVYMNELLHKLYKKTKNVQW